MLILNSFILLKIMTSKHTSVLRGKYYRQLYGTVRYFKKSPLNQSRFSLFFKHLLILCAGQIFQNYIKYILFKKIKLMLKTSEINVVLGNESSPTLKQS